ncbi:MAG: ABC transporter permease [Thermoanaerobaculales bacterium]
MSENASYAASPLGPSTRTQLPASGGGIAVWEAVRTTLAEIWAHKLRSFLTLFGVILGTLAVVVMVSIIEAIKVMVWDGIKGLGFDGVMFVSAQAPQDLVDRQKQAYSHGLEALDVTALRRDGDAIEAAAAVRIGEFVVSAKGEPRRVRVYGVTPSYAQVHDRSVSAGRWLDEGDQIESRKVAVLGIELAEKLFGSADPLGRSVRIGDAAFRVIGVEARLGNRFANSGWTRREMEGVLIPLSAFRAHLQGGERLALITVKTGAKENLDLVKHEVERLVRRSHHGISDFEVENIADEMLRAEKEVETELRNWTIILASLAGISLLVGGVGIYSVLKISLAERLYEIGLRKAIGASDRAILFQFMVESTLLSVLGAVIGAGVGSLVAVLLSPNFEAGLPVSPLGLALGFGFAVAVGLFAGVFPALSASRLTPVQALQG